MTIAGHAAAMRQCIANECNQGRSKCDNPRCAPRSVYLAPGVLTGPDDEADFRATDVQDRCLRWGQLVFGGLSAVLAFVAFAAWWLG